MGQFFLALLLPLFLTFPSPVWSQTPGLSQEKAATSPSQRPSEASASQEKPASPPSQGSIDKTVEQSINQALGQQQSSGGNPQMSPETEKAIETAVEKFLSDPEIKGAIGETISQASPLAMRGMLTGIIISVAFFALIALIAALLYWRSQARLRARMEFHTQLLSKFASGQEFTEFVNSKGSQQLIEGLWNRPLSARERILKRARGGAVFTTLGLGLLLALPWIEDKDFVVISVFFLALGIGFLISAAVSYRLSEKLGLLKESESPPTTGVGPQPMA